MNSIPQSASRRNNSDHHEPFNLTELSPGGAVVWRRTRRPPATCNLIAELANLGGGRAA